jgi:hypothetical protein
MEWVSNIVPMKKKKNTSKI